MTGYILCATPRSGSTLLCTLLASSGVAGQPQSWFRTESMGEYAQDWGIARDGAFAWNDYLAAAIVAGRGDTEVMGLRLMWPTLQEVLARLDGPLERAFGPLRYVNLRRLDTVAQAVSRLKAEVSGTWHLGFEEAEHPAEVVYDFARIKAYRDEAEADNIAWVQWFAQNGIVPLEVSYEDLSANPVAVAETVLKSLNLTLPSGQRLHASNRVMADTVSANWAARFRSDAAARGC
jgi:LPS sulfotransferase NodH